MTDEALRSWIGRTREPAQGAGLTDRAAAHSFLFWRVGEPASMSPMIVSRAALVGLCSGVVLSCGLVLMRTGVRRRWMWFGLPIVLLLGAVVVPSSVLGLSLQSSLVGGVLVAFAALTKRLVDRRVNVRNRFAEPSRSGLSTPTGSSVAARLQDPGSEASTVVRSRPGTTIDHAPATAGTAEPEAP